MGCLGVTSILNLAAPLDTAIALAPLFLTSQVGVKVATVKLVCIDTLVDPFWADTWLTNVFPVTPSVPISVRQLTG